MKNFSEIEMSAIKKCEGIYCELETRGFSLIYPFATENIKAYGNLFDLKNKNLLTVGSSGDQVFNAISLGCRDITIIDINPYTKYYLYLKYSGIICLTRQEFMDFFRYIDYVDNRKTNLCVFNKELYNKLKSTLRLIDYESYIFWDELVNYFDGNDIRNLFESDEYNTHVINNSNIYLSDNFLYEKLGQILRGASLEFILGDVVEYSFDKKFDNIWLSNVAKYLSLEEIQKLVNRVNELLKESGKSLFCYLYNVNEENKDVYYKDWAVIYNNQLMLEILKNFKVKLEMFQGIHGLVHDEFWTDAAYVLEK